MSKHPRLLMVAVAGLLPLSLALAANARPAPLESATLQAPASGLPAPASDTTLIDAAATKYQLGSTDLGVVSKTAVRLPVTGVSLVRAKVLDRSTNLTYGITLDAARRVGELCLRASCRVQGLPCRVRYGEPRAGTDPRRILGRTGGSRWGSGSSPTTTRWCPVQVCTRESPRPRRLPWRTATSTGWPMRCVR